MCSSDLDVAGQLRAMAKSQPGGGVAVDLGHHLADSATRAADKLDSGGVDAVMTDVKRFARRRPAMFLAGALGAGFAAGRLLKAVDTHALLEAASDEDPSAPEMIDLRSIESTQIASSTAARSVMAGVDSSGTAAPVAVGSTDLATEMP